MSLPQYWEYTNHILSYYYIGVTLNIGLKEKQQGLAFGITIRTHSSLIFA